MTLLGKNENKIGIMQPYFFPYWGHFALIANTDKWLVFDTAQYKKRYWINRNRVFGPNQKWQYLTLPIKNVPLKTPINQIFIKDPKEAFDKIIRQLEHYRKTAPFYDSTMELISNIFWNFSGTSLSNFNTFSLQKVCQHLQINFDYQLCSDIIETPEHEMEPGDWALHYAVRLNKTVYLNPISGAHLFSKSKFNEAGVRLEFLVTKPFVYDTGEYPFEKNLSILDVMMWCDTEKIKKQLSKTQIVGADEL